MTASQPRRLARYFRVFIEDLIAQRKYQTPVEVVEDALRLLEAREAKLDRLSCAVKESEASGPAVAFEMDDWLTEQDRREEIR